MPRSKHPTPVPFDADATLLGDAYRGSGVLIGILGTLIIFCAIAPFGLGIGGMQVAQIFGITEVVLMVWVILTVVSIRKGSQNKRDLKARWLEARSAADRVIVTSAHPGVPELLKIWRLLVDQRCQVFLGLN